METKPTFESVGDFARRSGHVLRHGLELFRLPGAFRERLMLAVTGVNHTRTCTFIHTRLARLTGVPEDEVGRLMAGDFSASPEDQRAALQFARETALTHGQVDQTRYALLEKRYGPLHAEAIRTSVEAILVTNYTGNALDRVLPGTH